MASNSRVLANDIKWIKEGVKEIQSCVNDIKKEQIKQGKKLQRHSTWISAFKLIISIVVTLLLTIMGFLFMA